MSEFKSDVQAKKPSRSFAVAAATETSFSDVIGREDLAKACLAALENTGKRGSGLNTLRLVCKQASFSMLKVIRGYTLTIDGSLSQLPELKIMKLNVYQLTRLRVKIKTGWVPENCVGEAQIQHMQRFLAAAAPFLRTITHLEISLHQTVFSTKRIHVDEANMAAVLAPLADACPMVQTLKLTGSIRNTAMAALGTAFKHLITLEVEAMPECDLQLLAECFPQVTATRLTLIADWDGNPDKPAYYQEGITSCPTLTYLDVGGGALTAELWQALPSGLQELHMGNFIARGDEYGDYEGETAEELGSTIPAGLQLPNLRAFYFEDNRMPLCFLADLLRSAPQLQSITVRNVLVPCDASQLPDLLLVHKRLAGGLKVAEDVQWQDMGGEPGPALLLHFETQEGSSSREFLLSLPVFEHFVRVSLEVKEPPQLADLVRVFPGLSTLQIRKPSEWMSEEDLLCLTVFPALQILDLLERPCRLNILQLGVVCAHIPLLQQLNVKGIFHLSAHTEILMRLLHMLGDRVVLNGRRWEAPL